MMAAMAESRPGTPSADRLLSVIELQNAIAAAGMTADEVMVLVCERARSLTAGATGGVAIVEGDDLVYRAVAGGGRAAGSRVARAGTTAGRSIAERRALIVDGAASAELCVPLLYGESAVGVLEVTAARAKAFGAEDTETLRLLAQVIAIALHRAYTYPRPRYDADHDALTGLGNRRAFDERIQAELTRNRRYGHSFSLAILELEGLESAIDRFGQAAGDDALREVARILQRHTRAIDACFRITANEVAIVMPGTSLEGAETLTERCRNHIVEARPLEGTVAASFGVAEATDETADALWTRTNAALATRKQARR
jgi:diguanylate cyclase (GGDEF)-like protein